VVGPIVVGRRCTPPREPLNRPFASRPYKAAASPMVRDLPCQSQVGPRKDSVELSPGLTGEQMIMDFMRH
jgi:hypothetical protein